MAVPFIPENQVMGMMGAFLNDPQVIFCVCVLFPNFDGFSKIYLPNMDRGLPNKHVECV